MEHELDAKYSAADLRSCAAPRGGGRPERVRDVLLVPIGHVEGDADLGREFTAHPPAGLRYADHGRSVDPGPADLGRGLMLGDLDREERGLIVSACSQRGHFFYPCHTEGIRYVFWRDVTRQALNENGVVGSSWDDGDVIVTALALSRWIHDNAAGTELAARIVNYDDGAVQVRPQAIYESSHVYRLPLVERDWLDADDAAALRALLDAYWDHRARMPERVSLAIGRGELASWSRWPDQTLPLVVAGFESLIATRIGELMRNFRRRLPLLAHMVGLSRVDADFADRIYTARSEGVHGQAVGLFQAWDPAAVADLRLAFKLLRRTLRTLVLRQDFAQHFLNKESIDRLFGHQTTPQFL